jgi:hypothetical protein
MIITGADHGDSLKITNERRALTSSLVISQQLHAAAHHQRSFQVISGIRNISSAGAYGILSLKNNDSDRSLIVTYIRMGVDKIETAQALCEIYVGGDWVAGTAVTPINLNMASNINASVTAHYNSVPTSSSLIDSRYLKGPDEVVYNKEGSIIVPTDEIISLKITTETAAVNAYGRLSFIMIENDELADY